jgi:light-regulated signal transduction histidine kinase (bacteriophytochrome)
MTQIPQLQEPIAVVAHGFGWTAAGAWGSFLVLLGIIIRQVGPWRKQSIDAGQRLRDDLLRRVEKLERELDRKEVRHQAERALDRHKLNNVTQCLDALLLLLEAAPEKAAEIVGKIKEMRSGQIKAETLEKAAIHAAAIVDADEREAFRQEDRE